MTAAPLKVRIESLGVYLPETVLTTAALMDRCRRRPRLDLEAITGIRERRVAVDEHALELAVHAAERALALSRYRAEDLDAVICTSISKHHRDDEFTFEPATAVLVRKAIGARRALVFDVVNACAGMLNGIAVLQALIRTGVVRNGMVVSGEQNLPLAESATREIRHSLDRQLAALTLGDAGAALILDAATDARHGIHHLELVTGAKHDHYCRSLPSPRGRGGILLTKARGLQRKGAEHFPVYLKRALDATGWQIADLQHVIPHQVSVRAVRQGVKVAGALFWPQDARHFSLLRGDLREHDDHESLRRAARVHAERARQPGRQYPARQRRLRDRHLARHAHPRRTAGALPRALGGRRRKRDHLLEVRIARIRHSGERRNPGCSCTAPG